MKHITNATITFYQNGTNEKCAAPHITLTDTYIYNSRPFKLQSWAP